MESEYQQIFANAVLTCIFSRKREQKPQPALLSNIATKVSVLNIVAIDP